MTILALAGRRIDAPGAPARFPLSAIAEVRTRLRALLAERGVSNLVSSAACGADLLALEEAGELGLKRRVILPYGADRFRETSVVDRPGDWGAIYDRIIVELQHRDELVILEDAGRSDRAYAAASEAILDQAMRIAGGQAEKDLREEVLAAIVWDGRPRGGSDQTAGFRDAALARGLSVIELTTLSKP